VLEQNPLILRGRNNRIWQWGKAIVGSQRISDCTRSPRQTAGSPRFLESVTIARDEDSLVENVANGVSAAALRTALRSTQNVESRYGSGWNSSGSSQERHCIRRRSQGLEVRTHRWVFRLKACHLSHPLDGLSQAIFLSGKSGHTSEPRIQLHRPSSNSRPLQPR